VDDIVSIQDKANESTVGTKTWKRENKRKKEKKSGDAMSVGREYHVFWTNGQWS
jgi:hypothetical protein